MVKPTIKVGVTINCDASLNFSHLFKCVQCFLTNEGLSNNIYVYFVLVLFLLDVLHVCVKNTDISQSTPPLPTARSANMWRAVVPG